MFSIGRMSARCNDSNKPFRIRPQTHAVFHDNDNDSIMIRIMIPRTHHVLIYMRIRTYDLNFKDTSEITLPKENGKKETNERKLQVQAERTLSVGRQQGCIPN